MFRHPPHTTRLVTGALMLGAVGAALAPGGPDALVPFKLALASADSVGDYVYVAVVVDFGSGSGRSPVVKCVPVLSSGRDTDALASAVGMDNVSYRSGLLCAIDNYPANGVQNCDPSTGGGNYSYWSYWHGSSGNWQYANNGPAAQPVIDLDNASNDVEGWEYQVNSPDMASDSPPPETSTYAQICNVGTEVPPPQPSQPPLPSPPPTPTPPTIASNTTPSTTLAVGPKKGISTTTTSTTATGPLVTPTTFTRTSSHNRTLKRRATALAAESAASHGSGGSPVLPIALICAVIGLLGGTAVFRWRRRPADE